MIYFNHGQSPNLKEEVTRHEAEEVERRCHSGACVVPGMRSICSGNAPVAEVPVVGREGRARARISLARR